MAVAAEQKNWCATKIAGWQWFISPLAMAAHGNGRWVSPNPHSGEMHFFMNFITFNAKRPLMDS